MLADKDSIVTIPFRAFLSNGTAPDVGLSNDSMRGSANGAAQFTFTNKVSAVSANAGMYVIVTTASETSVLGTLAVWYDQGDFPQHVANVEVVNSNPYSQMSNIAAKTYSGVTVGSLATIVAGDYGSSITFGVSNIKAGTYSGVTVGVNNVDKAVGAISGLSFAPVPGDYGSTFSVGVSAIKAASYSGVTIAGVTRVNSNVTIADADYSAVTVRVGGGTVTSVTNGVTVSTNNDKTGYGLAAGTYSGVTVGINNIAPNSYSGVTIDGVTRVNSSVTIANADYSGVTVRASNITIGTGGIVAASFGAGAVDAVALATDAGQEIADRILLRNVASGSDGGRSVAEAFYALRNRVAIDGSVMTVYQTNDTSSAWTASVATVSANSGLVNSVDPS